MRTTSHYFTSESSGTTRIEAYVLVEPSIAEQPSFEFEDARIITRASIDDALFTRLSGGRTLNPNWYVIAHEHEANTFTEAFDQAWKRSADLSRTVLEAYERFAL